MDFNNLMNNNGRMNTGMGMGMGMNTNMMGNSGQNWNLGFQPNPRGGYNPYAQHYEVIRVNGEAGANNFQMAPNSSQFLLDSSTNNLLWLVQTDGAGYLTATPFDIFPHQVQPPVDLNNLESRVKQLEDAYVQFTGTTKQSKKQRKADESATNAPANEPINSTN